MIVKHTTPTGSFLYYAHDCPGTVANFGDDLNHFVFPRTRKPSGNDDRVILGIGSVLGMRGFENVKTVVVGAGAGYHVAPQPADGYSFPYDYPDEMPSIPPDDNRTILAVRGPKTAGIVGLSDCPMFDPAIAIPTMVIKPDTIQGVSIMPHHYSHMFSDWWNAARTLGWRYIDPCWNVEYCIGMIASSEVLVTDCLHGAIVADAFRVPWIPIRCHGWVHRWKWQDWLASMGMEYQPVRVEPCLLPDRTQRYFGRTQTCNFDGAVRSLARAAEEPKQLSTDGHLAARMSDMGRVMEELNAQSPATFQSSA